MSIRFFPYLYSMEGQKTTERIYLSLNADAKQHLLNFYLAKRQKLETELNELDQNIAELKGESFVKNQLALPIEYSKDWNWPQKFEFILKQANKALNVQEICNEIASLEGLTLNSDDRNRINVALHYQANKGDLVYKKSIDGKPHYGLRKWDSSLKSGIENAYKLINELSLKK